METITLMLSLVLVALFLIGLHAIRINIKIDKILSIITKRSKKIDK